MSNLIYNGNFSLPNITTNTNSLVTSLTAQQKQQLFWYTTPSTTPLTYIVDGTGISNFPSPSLVGASQFIAMNSEVANINQDITIFNTGTYTLSFNHSRRNTFSTYNVLVSFAGTSIGVSAGTYNASSWSTFSNTYTVTRAGTLTLNIKYNVGTTNWIAITNVSLTPLLLNTDLSYNNLKNTNIFGALNVDDTVINGNTISGSIQTPQLLVGGTDLSTQLSTGVINFNYSTLPSYVSTNLGYNYYSGTPVASITSTDAANPTVIASIFGLPVGVYFISYTVTTYFGSTVGPILTCAVTQNGTTNIIWSYFYNHFHTTNYYYHASSSFTYNITTASNLRLVGWLTSSSATVLNGWTQLEAVRIA
jgi:hypothetical protein